MSICKKLTFLIVLITLTITTYAAPKEVEKAAQDGLQKFLKLISKDMLTVYGFSSETELKSCQLGTAFQLHTIAPKTLQSYQQGDTVESLTQDTGIWHFPVTYLQQNKAILVVAKVKNEKSKKEAWQAVSFGYSQLAKELQNIQKTWSQQRGFYPQLIVVYQACKYLFHVPQIDLENLTTITFNQTKVLNRTQSASSTIPSLWKDVQKNLERQDGLTKGQKDESKDLDSTPVQTFRKTLNVPQRYQKFNQWCWAGCTEALLNYYNKSISQERIAQEGTRGVNTWNWLSGTSQNPFRKGIKQLLQVWQVSSYFMSSSLGQSTLTTEINRGKPVVVRWGWDSGGGHFVICKGINGSTVNIMDPWSGPTMNSYNWMRRGSGHTWTHTLKVGR